jgi:hypothetical protein
MAEASEFVKSSLLPRTVFGWVKASEAFEGKLPGSNIDCKLIKSEAGYCLDLDGTRFQGTPERISAAIVLTLDSNPVSYSYKPSDIARLGKTIDLLIKAGNYHPKAEVAKPLEAIDAGKTETKMPKKTKLPYQKRVLAFKKSCANNRCNCCGGIPFKNDKFVGCYCMKSLAKHTVTGELNADYYLLDLGPEWDAAAITILIETENRGDD